jgi:hypothetical protein
MSTFQMDNQLGEDNQQFELLDENDFQQFEIIGGLL